MLWLAKMLLPISQIFKVRFWWYEEQNCHPQFQFASSVQVQLRTKIEVQSQLELSLAQLKISFFLFSFTETDKPFLSTLNQSELLGPAYQQIRQRKWHIHTRICALYIDPILNVVFKVLFCKYLSPNIFKNLIPMFIIFFNWIIILCPLGNLYYILAILISVILGQTLFMKRSALLLFLFFHAVVEITFLTIRYLEPWN